MAPCLEIRCTLVTTDWCCFSGCDCGLYVICITEFLCQQKLSSITANFSVATTTLQSSITPQTVSNKRRQLKELILSLSSASWQCILTAFALNNDSHWSWSVAWRWKDCWYLSVGFHNWIKTCLHWFHSCSPHYLILDGLRFTGSKDLSQDYKLQKIIAAFNEIYIWSNQVRWALSGMCNIAIVYMLVITWWIRKEFDVEPPVSVTLVSRRH